MKNIDEVDLKILELLELDSSLPYTEIARRLKMKESTIRKRIIALKRSGVIKKFSIILDPSKIGMKVVAIIGIDVDPSRLLEVAQKLSELKEARFVATSTGDHMIMIEVWAKDGKELAKLISEKIGAIEGIKKICPAIILEKIKE